MDSGIYIGFRFNVGEQSVISGGTSTEAVEVSSSNNSISHLHNKYVKHEYAASGSKFIGAVSQQDGHWGAQKHRHIWLGTFSSEKEAAMAYDSVAIELCNGDSQCNFPWNDVTICEPNFQGQFSTGVLLNMIKDGSNASKFSDYMSARAQVGHSSTTLPNTTGFLGRQLFQKELVDPKKCVSRCCEPLVYTRKQISTRFDRKFGRKVAATMDMRDAL